MTEAAQLTPAQEKENAIQAKASFDFMVKHPEYINNSFNNNLLGAWVAKRGLPWRLENIEKAFEALLEADELDATPPAESQKTAPVTEPEFPWPTPLTQVVIAMMDRNDYKKFLKDQRFREQLRALGIKA
jgi:hypothetical protein